MAIKITSLAVLAGLLLCACETVNSVRSTSGTSSAFDALDESRSVLVAVPADGAFEENKYTGTGRIVAEQTAAAFGSHARHVQVADSAAITRDRLLEDAKNTGREYVVIPMIANWEPRATEWSGIPTRVSISISVLDSATGESLKSALLDSRGKIWTFVRQTPASLSGALIEEYVATLYE